jgi:hypothetical protein
VKQAWPANTSAATAARHGSAASAKVAAAVTDAQRLAPAARAPATQNPTAPAIAAALKMLSRHATLPNGHRMCDQSQPASAYSG